MTFKPFPEHFRIILEADERNALEALFENDSHLIDELELLHDALRAGIRVLNQADVARRKDPDRPSTRTEVEVARKRSAGHASSPDESFTGWQVPSPHRHVERYLGFPLTEDLRQKFEDYLNEHTKISEEDAGQFLLDQGLFRDREMMAKYENIEDLDAIPNANALKDARAAARLRRLARVAKLRAVAGGYR